nr:hypothetical protein [Streptomyces sp. SID10853]
MLGRPVRIRVPELLRTGPMAVRVCGPGAVGVERSALSRHLAAGDVADFMRAARRTPTEMPTGQNELSGESREAEAAAS